jgi:hypothetical protein
MMRTSPTAQNTNGVPPRPVHRPHRNSPTPTSPSIATPPSNQGPNIPYIPVVPQADRRQRYGMAPLRLLNMFAVPIPSETGKPVRAALVPTPGRVQRLDLGTEIQGIF